MYPIRSDSTVRRKIALIAHDNQKLELLEWARWNRDLLAGHELFATGTTGRLLENELDLKVECFQSGPLGGDQQIGSRIAEGAIDCLVFFWDPLAPQPHDPDVKPCCASPWCGTSRWPAIARQPTTWSLRY